MPDNKNQHFVPRCHLKPFSVDRNGRQIHLFNIKGSKIIRSAPLKSQCSRAYFYGHDRDLERAIQLVEAGYSAAVRDLVYNKDQLSAATEIVFRRFAYLQLLRTEEAARQAAEAMLASVSIKGSDLEVPSLPDAIKEAALTAMRIFANTMKTIDDLKIVVIVNHASTPFITSDNPSVMANRWYQVYEHARHRSFGIGSAGLIIFLPISPKFLILLYDADIYRVEAVNKLFNVYKSEDILLSNQMQIFNCGSNIYFSDDYPDQELSSAVSFYSKMRPLAPFVVHRAVFDTKSHTHTRYRVVSDPDVREHEEVLTHVQTKRAIPSRWPSFLKFRRMRFAYTNDTGAGYRRKSTAVSESWDAPSWRKINLG